MLLKSIIFSSAGAFILTACVSDPSAYETTPVQVKTTKGVVTCQLYTKERVIWDRAIGRPKTMSVKEADDICLREGTRIKEL